VHHGPAPEKVYPGAVNALARSYKWLLETLGLRIDPLRDGAEPRPRCIARLSDRHQAPPKAKRLADRPQLLREMKQRSQRSRGNCQAPRTDIPRLSEGQLSSRPRRCSFATVAAVKGHED
jgi:hypothetical protein